jgi:subtilisin family serine protease
MTRVVPGAIQAFATAFVLFLLVCSTLGQAGIDAAAQTSVTKTTAGYALPRPGRVVVVLKSTSEFTAASDVAAAADITPKYTFRNLFPGFSGYADPSQLRILARDTNVLAVIEDRMTTRPSAQTVPNQILRTGIDKYGPAAINGDDALTNVDIGIIDTGVDIGHPDLNVVGGYNCADPGSSFQDVDSQYSHGTHVAGIAAGRDNQIGTAGAAPGARVLAFQVFEWYQGELVAADSSIACALDFGDMDGNPLDVVNMSLGGPGPSSSCGSWEDIVHEAVCQSVGWGTTVVVAAGNAGDDASYYTPANYPEVITVGAIADYNGRPGGGSSDYCGSGGGADDRFGSYSNYGSPVDIVAPGMCIFSTMAGGYGTISGTSMASPLVAGAAALYKSQNPGASPGEVKNWLLSTGSVAANSENGYSGASYRLLHLGGAAPVTNPPGISNPTFTGSKAATTNAIDSPNTGTANRVRDNNFGTNWSTAQNSPTSATLTIDLGSSIKLTGIKWRWSNNNYGDQFDVRVSTSLSGPWSTVGRFGNGTSTTAWFGATTGHTARFVQFLFTNPNRDAVLGAISEVEIWRQSAVVNPPGTQNPSIPGEKIRLTNAFDSPSTGTANKVRDGSPSSNWSTAQNRPAAASITVDLGASTRITGIRWLWTNINYADQFDVQVATSVSGPWTTIGRYGNGTATYTWFGTTTNTTARFVRFAFGNPNRDLVLGALGEIEVFKPSVTVNPPGIQNPNVGSFFKQPVTNVFDSPNTGTAGRVKDGTAYTNWAVQGRPTTASITLDMGSTRAVNTIRWMMPNLGYADQFQVRVATEYGSWTSLGTFGNPTSSYTWFGIELPFTQNARFVQFVFANPNGDVALGAIGEIEIWGGMPTAAANDDPVFAGEALEIVDATSTGGDVSTNGEVSVSIEAAGPATVTSVLETEPNAGLTGVRWMSAAGIAVTISTSDDGATWKKVTSVRTIDNGHGWQGISLPADPDARFVRVEARPGSVNVVAELEGLEIWGLSDGAGTPVASPEAGTPIASPEVPIGTPVVTEEPTFTPTDEPTEAPATPVVTEEPTSTATEESTEAPATPIATEEPTSTPTGEPTDEPTEKTATPEPTAEPTAALLTGTITGTDGDLVNCRVSAPDGEPITQLAEGDAVAITGEPVDGWYPVTCAGEDGWVSEAFVTIGDVLPTPEPSPDASPTSEATEDVLPTEEPTLEPTAEPEVTAYEIVDTGDTEESGTAWNAQDDDPSTVWSVSPSQAPDQVRLYLDLGQVRPIDRLTFTLRTWDQLPVFEIWLSEDAETWYNVTPDGINGWNLPRDEEISIALGYDARYLRIVIPHADESGLGQIGGIDDLQVWPGDITQTALLGNVFAPTTPTPEAIPTEEPTEEVIPTVEPTVEEIAEPTEEPVVEEPTEEAVEDTPEPEPTEEVVG